MNAYSESLNELIEEFLHLPGIGPKAAQRLALHVINLPKARVDKLVNTISTAKEKVCFCKKCYNLTDSEYCSICSNEKRDSSTIMVVEEPSDLSACEKMGQYKGLYHVLHGAMNPMAGVQPENLKIKELMQRLQVEDIKELILATNSTLEGETTAMYISKVVKPTGIKVTRIASGVSVGSALESTDEMTLLRALEGRVEL